MQHDPDPLISIKAAAEKIGVNRSTLSRQVRDKQVRSHKGKVRLSEVLEDRANNIDLSRSARHRGALDEADEHVASPLVDATPPLDATPDEPVLVDGQVLPFKEARALKETYLARLRQLQYRREIGEVVPIDEAVAVVSAQYSVVRERILAVPVTIAGRVPAPVRDAVMAIARDECHRALAELTAEDSLAKQAAQAAVRKRERS